MSTRRMSLLSIAVLGSACSGLIGDAGSDEQTGADLAELCADAPPNVGHAPLRRLTRLEYENTVRPLLGSSDALPVELASDSVTAGFAANNNSFAGEHDLEAYMESADALADIAVSAGLDTLPELSLDCDTATEPCMRTFVERFGRRAFRRALTPEEVDRYMALYVTAEQQWNADTAQRLVLRAFLQSPHFLYLPELGTAAGELIELNGYELAARLSFFLWKTMPDEQLLAAAEEGALADVQTLEEEVRRMLADERAQDTIASFHAQWLHIANLDSADKDPASYPEWSPELGAALRDETLAVAIATIWDPAGDAKLATLFTTTRSFASDELAAFYEVTPGGDGAIAHDPSERAGILTHASVMAALAHANDTSWVQRGRFVREEVLCDPVPPPPPDVDMSVLNDGNRLEADGCKHCHLLMDPIGAGFEGFDAIGRHRDEYPALPEGPLTPFRIEPSGSEVDVSGEFATPVDLAHKLATSRSAADCMATKWYTFATMRAPEDEDACAVHDLQERFAAAGFDVRELIVGIATAEGFRLRRSAPTQKE